MGWPRVFLSHRANRKKASLCAKTFVSTTNNTVAEATVSWRKREPRQKVSLPPSCTNRGKPSVPVTLPTLEFPIVTFGVLN